MPTKPNGALCAIKEQIVEDLASGLILQFECRNGRTRLVIAGTLVGEFRRPSWLKEVP